MGFLSSHDVPVPPGLPVVVHKQYFIKAIRQNPKTDYIKPVVVVCRQLEWVVCLLPSDGFSACYVVPHMLTQCISQLLASALWWSTAP